MARPSSIAVLLITLLCQSATASESDRLQAAFERIDASVMQHMEREGTVAGVIALTDRDGLLWEKAFGTADRESRKPATTETLFQIASITKSFTAIALLQWVDDGRLRLDAPVSDYLPWFSVRSDFEPIRVHHLMTHTAGIPANRDDIPSSPYMALALREQLAAWPPGERFHYSNVGYQVLHVLLEKVSGKSWAENVGKRILQPLGMADSELAITNSNRDRQAVGYLPSLADRPHHVSRPLVRAPFVEYSFGDGCIVATASDMARYLRMLLHRGQGPAGRILSASGFAAFATPWIQPWGATAYGYGIAVREKEGLQLLHGGGSVGASAMIAADLGSGIGAAVMLTGPGNPQALALFALETLKAAMAGETLPALPVEVDSMRVENAEEFAGSYRSLDGSILDFVADKDRLFVLHQGRSIGLEVREDGTFYTTDSDFDRFYLRFEKDEQDRVVELTHGPRWFSREGKEVPVDPSYPAGWKAYRGQISFEQPLVPRLLRLRSKRPALDLDTGRRRDRSRRGDSAGATRRGRVPTRRGSVARTPGLRRYDRRPGLERNLVGASFLQSRDPSKLERVPRPESSRAAHSQGFGGSLWAWAFRS